MATYARFMVEGGLERAAGTGVASAMRGLLSVACSAAINASMSVGKPLSGTPATVSCQANGPSTTRSGLKATSSVYSVLFRSVFGSSRSWLSTLPCGWAKLCRMLRVELNAN